MYAAAVLGGLIVKMAFKIWSLMVPWIMLAA